MVSILLVASLATQNSKDGLTFTYREHDSLTFLNVDNGKIKKEVTNCFRVGLRKESISSGNLTIQLGEIENGQRITVDFRDGRKAEVDVEQAPKHHWRTIGVASSERYLFAYVQNTAPTYVTSIYRIEGSKCPLVCTVPGRVIDILGTKIISTTSKSEIMCRDISRPELEESNTPLANRLKAVYAVRSKTASHDPARYYDFESAKISDDGKYWFEASHNTFGPPVLNKYIVGDVILSGKGVEWQWKSNVPNLRGSYFLNAHTYRFFRTAKFMLGAKTQKWYEPGVYELDLRSKRVKRLSTKPLSMIVLSKCRLRQQ